MEYTIIQYDKQYRDEVFFCYLLAKEALGATILKIREDLFDIQKNYLDTNDMFWIALSSENRVIGMLGTKTVSSADLWLKRLFIKPQFKRNGLGKSLLLKAESYSKDKGITTIHTRFNDNYVEAECFYLKNGFYEVEQSDGLRHFVKDI